MYYSHILYRLVSGLVCCVCDRQYQVLFVVSSMTASFEQFVVACFEEECCFLWLVLKNLLWLVVKNLLFVVACFEEFVVCCIWPCLKHVVVCCSFFEEF